MLLAWRCLVFSLPLHECVALPLQEAADDDFTRMMAELQELETAAGGKSAAGAKAVVGESAGVQDIE